MAETKGPVAEESLALISGRMMRLQLLIERVCRGAYELLETQRRTARRSIRRRSADCKMIMGKLGIPLGGPDGTGKPIFRAELIKFNGRTSEGCETFEVGRIATGRHGDPTVFQFCKTNQRPYDLCVQIALIVLKHHLDGAITVSSDGNDIDWEAARNRCQKWLGYGNHFRLEQ